MLPLHATFDPGCRMERWATEWRSGRKRGGGVKEARVAERRDLGKWILGVDVAERPATKCRSWETDRGGQSRGAAEGDTFSIA